MTSSLVGSEICIRDRGQVAGIITKTSMASAMAEQLWG